MELKLSVFVEQLMMDTFMVKLTQFEKTGSKGITFISLGNRGVCLPFNNRNALKSQVRLRKIKIEREQVFRLFPEKKTIKNQQEYIRVLTTFIYHEKQNGEAHLEAKLATSRTAPR